MQNHIKKTYIKQKKIECEKRGKEMFNETRYLTFRNINYKDNICTCVCTFSMRFFTNRDTARKIPNKYLHKCNYSEMNSES